VYQRRGLRALLGVEQPHGYLRLNKQPNTQLAHAGVARNSAAFPVCVIADDLELPVNIGGLFRIADALGVEKLYLTGNSPVPPNRKIRKSSRATEQVVPYVYHATSLELVPQLRAAGYTIVALELTTRSRDLRSWRPAGPSKLALIIGNEKRGVSQAVLDAADETLHISMRGQNSSMNVTTACAIALFELTRHF
jgi:tRNA G18 (ribose-2'-O)-methylase SpoU